MKFHLIINGRTTELECPNPPTVAAALAMANFTPFRHSPKQHTPRLPVCGMGACFECRVTINGRAHQRACQVIAEDGMEIYTYA
ncbi:(2Fe-2S)-binding protein [Chitinivorax sp. B]|uniref:(2Fe-2S)-binding protein n=1 Tax=Chitinivorax sp. B TaxID=2502235 RepID=UPI0010F801D2|nr:(2Fe-2S)-binding protein [Chitinivorax sp. B]